MRPALIPTPAFSDQRDRSRKKNWTEKVVGKKMSELGGETKNDRAKNMMQKFQNIQANEMTKENIE